MSTTTIPRRHAALPAQPARRRRRKAAAAEPDVRLTADGRVLLERRARHLLDDVLPELRPLLTRRERDERDVAEFERLCAEVVWLQRVLDTSGAVEEPIAGRVSLGSHALVLMPDGERVWVRPVHPVEAFLDEERISSTSPLSVAILGREAGDVVTVDGPSGPWICEVVEVHAGCVDAGLLSRA